MGRKKHLLEYSLPELTEYLKSNGFQGFIAKQLFDWVYKKFITDFSEMRNINKANQGRLAELLMINDLQSVAQHQSEDGQAEKLILTLSDGCIIESVVINEKTYKTLCISTQVGCPLKCEFCCTGQLGFKRHLTTAEIILQLLTAYCYGHDISNIVFMGMGEPLLNLTPVLKAIQLIQSPDTFDISKRKTTVSTVGISDAIQTLIDQKIVLNIAFSVGHPDPAKRVRLIPNEKKHPITKMCRLFYQYQKLHNRQMTLEYTLLAGVNDQPQDICELINIAKYLKAKINLIQFNHFEGCEYQPTTKDTNNKILQMILDAKIPASIRVSKGIDIGAACGQLGRLRDAP